MPIFDVVDQDAILRELGISSELPAAKSIARKVSDDHLILDRAMQLAIAAKIPQVLSELTPVERARLVKRTQPEAPTVQFRVVRRDHSGEAIIVANGRNATEYFTGRPENAHLWRFQNATPPAEVIAEYKLIYQPHPALPDAYYQAARLPKEPASRLDPAPDRARILRDENS